MIHEDITETILGCCFDVVNELGTGFLERVYKNALMVVLKGKGIKVKEEVPYEIYFREQKIGHYVVDLLVEDQVLVELKCCKSILPEHQAQLINYLKTTRLNVGLLVNFGNSRLECKRLYG